MIRAGVFVGLATWVLALIFQVILIPWELFPALDWKTIGIQSLAAVGSGIVTAMIVGGALPILESLFRITTDISWLEAADLNHPLLKRMTIDAPRGGKRGQSIILDKTSCLPFASRQWPDNPEFNLPALFITSWRKATGPKFSSNAVYPYFFHSF